MPKKDHAYKIEIKGLEDENTKKLFKRVVKFEVFGTGEMIDIKCLI